METIIIIAAILVFPYVLFFWVYGFIRVKQLISKELTKAKSLLVSYERLSAEDRMELDRKIIEKKAPVGKTEWVTSPTPRQEAAARIDVLPKEGILPVTTTEDAKPPTNQRPNP